MELDKPARIFIAKLKQNKNNARFQCENENVNALGRWVCREHRNHPLRTCSPLQYTHAGERVGSQTEADNVHNMHRGENSQIPTQIPPLPKKSHRQSTCVTTESHCFGGGAPPSLCASCVSCAKGPGSGRPAGPCMALEVTAVWCPFPHHRRAGHRDGAHTSPRSHSTGLPWGLSKATITFKLENENRGPPGAGFQMRSRSYRGPKRRGQSMSGPQHRPSPWADSTSGE